MLRRVPLALLLTFMPLALAPVSAQPFVIEEAVGGGGPSADTGEGIALADDGSRYVVGTFEGTATFGEMSVTSAGDSDIFLVKYDADLNAVWARRAGTDVFNDFGESVAVGPDGSVYATGFFTGIATWDGGNNPDVELTTFSDFDAFVAKYTPEGDLEWVQQVGGTGQDTGRDVAADAAGNVYLVGGFEGVGTFGTETLTSAGSSDAFLVKYDADGDVVWARRGGSDQGDLAYGVAVTDDGAAHVSGSFRGVAQFGGLPIQSAGATDVFVVQYDTDGVPVWVEGIGADGSEFTRGGGIGLDGDGNVYVTGSFSNTILVASDVLESTGFTDIFVAKLDSEGNEVWGRRGGGDGTNFSAALTVDAGDNVLATGYIDGTGTFTDAPITTQGRDGYLAVLDHAGDLVTVELLGGTGQDEGTGIAVNDALARFAATGSFRGTATFGDFEITSAGSSDAYVIGGPTAGEPVPSTLFVDADATGTETGLSWTDAFTDLQDAFALAATLDADSLAIWVAEGTYYPTDDGDRTVSFELQSGLAIYGGFDGTESSIDERDLESNETILSGDLGVQGNMGDNSFHVLVAVEVTGISIDGLTVSDGAPALSFGGGLSLISSSADITSCTFRNNGARDSEEAARGGGALYALGGSTQIHNSSFIGNAGSTGGAVLAAFGSLELTSSFFSDNIAVKGGALGLDSAEPSLVSGCEFISNETVASGIGGAIYIKGFSPAIINSTFISNVATRGGAIGASRFFTDPVIIGGTFIANQSGYGGALFISSKSSLSVFNSLFLGNFTESGELEYDQGGSIYNDGQLVVINTTIVANEARNEGGAIYSAFESSSVEIQNSALWGNTPDQLFGNVSADHVLVEGGYAGTSILDADPLFVRLPSPGPDEQWGTQDDDYGDLRLQEGSPAIDFGLAEFLPPDTFDLDEDGDTEESLPVDLDGGPRVLGNEIDLGAYESPFAVALEPGAGVPTVSDLAAAYPNPFHSRTTLSLDVAEAQDVTVDMFDVLGRRVATVHDGPLDVGQHRVVIESGGLPAGVYIVRAEGESFRFTQRVTLVR